jgi:ribulose-bisphosphate carboxylase large chain
LYLIQTPIDPRRAAELIASEQSIGSFKRVQGETDEVIARFGGRVEEVQVLSRDECAALPSAMPDIAVRDKYTSARVRISFPAENFSANVSSLFAILLGNLFELQELSGIRLLDFDMPKAFSNQFFGPAFGVAGTRKLAQVAEGPIVGTIVKPKLGLTPPEIAGLVTELGEAGIQFIKDDECMTNPGSAPLRQRIDAVCDALDRVADRTGRKPLYAFNISDDSDQMMRNHDHVVSRGGQCVMVSVNACGLSAVAALRRHSQLPIHGHRAGWGMLTRHPYLGTDFLPYQKLWRLAGVDQLHIGGMQSKFFENDHSVAESGRACLRSMDIHRPIMPVISSGQWGGQAPATYAALASQDVIYLAGGAVLGHPLGPQAGVAALKEAWQAAVDGVPLLEYARSHPALKASIETFGNLRTERTTRNV